MKVSEDEVIKSWITMHLTFILPIINYQNFAFLKFILDNLNFVLREAVKNKSGQTWDIVPTGRVGG